MFPLERAVLPTTLVPLHIFEPRYRELARVVTARDDPEFGITMIERGREVGGGDDRAPVGVVARVLQGEEFPDGRWGLICVATRRITVIDWLADDPYPRAQVHDAPDDDAETYLDALGGRTVAGLRAALERIEAAAVRLDPARPARPPNLDPDPAVATWQAAVSAELGPLDAYALLEVAAAAPRAELAARLLDERAEVLEALADQGG